MSYLVTGASGAVGAHVARRLLEKGIEVVSIRHDEAPHDTASLIGVRDRITWARGDIANAEFVRRVVADYGPECIIHLAALPLVQVATRTTTPIFQVNTMGTVNLLEAVKENQWAGKKIRFVYMSTDKAMGDCGSRPYLENMALNPVGIYDASKACADIIARTYVKCGLVNSLAVVRPCNILAPGDLNFGRVLPRMIIPCLRGEQPILYKTKYLREFIAVDDAIDGILAVDRLLKQDRVSGEAFNVGSGEQRSFEQVVAEVLRHFPELTPEWTDPPAVSRVELEYQKLDSSKLRDEAGWIARAGFAEAVERVVSWWRNNWSSIPEPIRNHRVHGWHG